ncbi:MAG: YraN family protein [Bacteroidales bacterium]|nr:YraN family protein [Bacteroidales bacterium]
METIDLGRAGEDAALEWLQERGMTLLKRNWRCGHYELDLVMEYGDSIRIVEVKSLRESDGFDPTVNMTPEKCRRLVRAARRFLAENPDCKEVFFEVVAVIFRNGTPQISYIPSAFLPIHM